MMLCFLFGPVWNVIESKTVQYCYNISIKFVNINFVKYYTASQCIKHLHCKSISQAKNLYEVTGYKYIIYFPYK